MTPKANTPWPSRQVHTTSNQIAIFQLVQVECMLQFADMNIDEDSVARTQRR